MNLLGLAKLSDIGKICLRCQGASSVKTCQACSSYQVAKYLDQSTWIKVLGSGSYLGLGSYIIEERKQDHSSVG